MKMGKEESARLSMIKDNKLIYSFEFENIEFEKINNSGTLMYYDRYNKKMDLHYYTIVDEFGKFVSEITTDSITAYFFVTYSNKYAIMIDNESIKVYDVKVGKQLSDFEPNFVWYEIDFNEESEMLIFNHKKSQPIITDLQGKLINKNQYESHLKEKGSFFENLRYLELNNSKEELFQNENYEKFLKESLISSQKYAEYKSDNVLKLLGEISLNKGDDYNAYQYWIKANDFNPKIGLKSKLNKLKKKLITNSYNLDDIK